MALLHVTVRWATTSGAASAADLVAKVDPAHTVGELAAAVARHVGVEPGRVGLSRHGRPVPSSSAVFRSGIVSGDDLTLVTTGSSPDAGPGPGTDGHSGGHLVVDVVGGPDAGRSFRIGVPGRLVVGRSATADVLIDDPTVSRRHATIAVDAGGGVTVTPHRGAVNGVRVEGTEIDGPTAISSDELVTLGGTRLAVRPAPPISNGRPDPATGCIAVHRSPYRPSVVGPVPVPVPLTVPEQSPGRSVPVWSVLTPLVTGGVMYLFSQQAVFLVLTLVSPLLLVGMFISDRWSGRSSERIRVARFRTELADLVRIVERRRDAEARQRRRACPDLADLVHRAVGVTDGLWIRSVSAPDAFVVRIGVAGATATAGVELAPGGDDALRAEAHAAVESARVLTDVPVAIDLRHDSVVAVEGDPPDVDGLVASLVVQAAVLHCPDDLVIVAALAPARRLGWLAWLPHCRSPTSPFGGNHLVRTVDDADEILDRLSALADSRRSGRQVSASRLLVVLDADLGVDRARLARFLDAAPGADIATVVISSTGSGVPRHATRVVEVRRSSSGLLRARLWSTDPTVPDVDAEAELLGPELAERVARALAPLRDVASGSVRSSIPDSVPLLEVLGLGSCTPEAVVARWRRSDPGHLRFPAGIGSSGPVLLDLVDHGPHALVAGTSGAGKSELLRSLVVALATHHPPTHLTVLFIDYKGGASSQVFADLPHHVGTLTDLSPELAERALVSLRAEVHRRMVRLEGRAKDLAELRSVAPDEAPPSLVIVVDEFATLVREVPDFVAGVVDIAERGRSLGIHLVLATQRPAGAVDDRILANTNLRIALRLLDRSDSVMILDAPDAAAIPLERRGRALVRLGTGALVGFQVGLGDAAHRPTGTRPAVAVGRFDTTDACPPTGGSDAAAEGEASGPTHLQVAIDSIVEAARSLGLPSPRPTWCPVLPDRLAWADLPPTVGLEPGRQVVIGLLDVPERRQQRPAVIDLEAGGGLLVIAGPGAGATTLVRTVTASVTASAADGSAGPAVALGVPVDDPEVATRLVVALEDELLRRSTDTPDAGPSIVLLVDGLGRLADSFGEARSEWIDRLVRIVVEGRRRRIHAVVTAERRSVVPGRLAAAMSDRLVLRHPDPGEAVEPGARAGRLTRLPPGRGLLTTATFVGATVQVVLPPVDGGDGPSRTGHRLLGTPLPTVLASASVVPPVPTDPGAVVLGVADVSGSTVTVDVGSADLVVVGPPRSGRSTALATIAVGLAAVGRPVVVVGSASSPIGSLAGRPGLRVALGAAAAGVLDALDAPDGPPPVLVVDDADDPDLDPALVDRLTAWSRSDRIRFVVATSTGAVTGFGAAPWLVRARRSRRLLVLVPDDPGEFARITGLRRSWRPGLELCAGRGLLVVDRAATLIQVAQPPPIGGDTRSVPST